LLEVEVQREETQMCYLHVPNRVRVMVFDATFNNISVISWRKSEYPAFT